MRFSNIERHLRDLPLIVVMPDGGRGWYQDATNGANYGTAIGVELPELIENTFKTKMPWAISGLSMGGYGALLLGTKHPGLFTSVHSMSGAFTYGHKAEIADSELVNVFGRHPQGTDKDLFEVLKNAFPRPRMLIDCGVDDHLIGINRDLHNHLVSLKIDHNYKEFPGAHTWDYWDEHVVDGMAFHREALGF